MPEKNPKIVSSSELSEVAAKVKQGNRAHAERIRNAVEASRPILEDLAAAGYKVETLAQLRHLGRPWKAALRLLLRWLPFGRGSRHKFPFLGSEDEQQRS